jgi:hypothetical protein
MSQECAPLSNRLLSVALHHFTNSCHNFCSFCLGHCKRSRAKSQCLTKTAISFFAGIDDKYHEKLSDDPLP